MITVCDSGAEDQNLIFKPNGHKVIKEAQEAVLLKRNVSEVVATRIVESEDFFSTATPIPTPHPWLLQHFGEINVYNKKFDLLFLVCTRYKTMNTFLFLTNI